MKKTNVGFALMFISFLEQICAFVPIAPVLANEFSASDYASVGVPTMIVVGEKDSGLGRTSTKYLTQISTATAPQVIPNGRHPAYLDDHKVWHTLLYNFIKRVHC